MLDGENPPHLMDKLMVGRGERDLTASSSGANCRDPPEEENAGNFDDQKPP